MTSPSDSWAAEAVTLLERLGFQLLDGDRPEPRGRPRLLIALRESPTLEHFDPEQVTFWSGRGGRGHLITLDRKTVLPLERQFSWGRIHVIDRIPVANRFLTFGGTLHAVAVTPALTVMELSSPAPILRWSGHSQGVDRLTDEVGAFFGRLKIPIDYTPGAESRIADASPVALFAAMVSEAAARLASSERLRTADPIFAGWISREVADLRSTAPEAYAEGEALRSELPGLD